MTSKYAPTTTLDQELIYISGANCQTICSASSTTYTDCLTANMLVKVTMTSGSSGGDYTIAADTNGEKVTVAAKSGVSITNSGTGTCACLLDTTGSTIRLITTISSQVLTAGGTCDIPAWKFNIQNPT